MATVLKAISDWIKSLLTAAIMSNLSGLFDDVNTQVGGIAQQVGTKPSSFEPRVFAMIEALSRNVVLPIAGVILTFIACYELIEMITQHNNMPTEQSTINGALKRLIEKNNLPKVVFHSFRHSSITYKLKLNGGDIKAVQGDSGHAQASMVTEQYAHILDDDRRLNAQRFDDFFYQHQGAEPEMPHQTAQPIPENSAVDADAAAALTKLLANPSMAELIKNLAKNL